MNGKSTIGSDGDYSVRICVKQWMKYAANILTLMSLLCLIYTNKAVYTATFVAGGWAMGRGSNELGMGSDDQNCCLTFFK